MMILEKLKKWRLARKLNETDQGNLGLFDRESSPRSRVHGWVATLGTPVYENRFLRSQFQKQ